MAASRRRPAPPPAARREAVGRAIARREAAEQTAAILAGLPRCEHGEYAAACPRCLAQHQVEVPF